MNGSKTEVVVRIVGGDVDRGQVLAAGLDGIGDDLAVRKAEA